MAEGWCLEAILFIETKGLERIAKYGGEKDKRLGFDVVEITNISLHGLMK